MRVILTCIGLPFQLVGTWLLGYDLIRGPLLDWETLSLSTRLNLEHRWLDELQRRQKLIPLHLEDQADGGKWLANTIDKSKKTIEELEKQRKKIELEHKNRTGMWGWRGLIIVTIGLVLQIVGTCI